MLPARRGPGPMTSSGNAAPPEAIREMFDRIAPVYDAMNSVMTAGLDRRWRQAAVRAAGLRPGQRALDVACGTGRLSEDLAHAVSPGGMVLGIDVSEVMLARAARRAATAATAALPGAVVPDYRHADALALPFDDAAFDAATIAFGLRNLPDYVAGLSEMRRVVRPGGRIVVLEIAVPASGPARLLFETWFRRLVPLMGRLVRRRSAYRYLPQSLLEYPAPEAVAGLLAAAGLQQVRWRRLPSGMATLHVGVVPDP